MLPHEAPPTADDLMAVAIAAAEVLGPDHRATMALANAIAGNNLAMWHARLALKTLRREQREQIALAAGVEPAPDPLAPFLRL